MTAIQDKLRCATYSRARLARDERFDGLFFTAVRTTGIYCRPICPANPPKESNVEYHESSISASIAGFRPCLRCRPDSAPGSNGWIGNEVTLNRAVALIDSGVLAEQSVEQLANRLGVSSRYLRALFKRYLGTSPKAYGLHRQCLFAKQLLHDSNLSVADVAFASGFNSVRRFNEAMRERLLLSPRQIRKGEQRSVGEEAIHLTLSYRPPFDWTLLFDFLRPRLIENLEWIGQNNKGPYYGRTITLKTAKGSFELQPDQDKNQVDVRLRLDDVSVLNGVVQRIRAVSDLDANSTAIDAHLRGCLPESFPLAEGLRIPGVWGSFEAGIRAILGQQVSVQQAHQLVTTLVQELGQPLDNDDNSRQLFPSPECVLESELSFFRMPQSRKDTIHRLAEHFICSENPDDHDAWQTLKGIGPWTVNYVKLRAAKNPDIWLDGDSGLKNALKVWGEDLDVQQAAPWRSYLVFQLWNSLTQ